MLSSFELGKKDGAKDCRGNISFALEMTGVKRKKVLNEIHWCLSLSGKSKWYAIATIFKKFFSPKP